ncbi:MAG: flavodoxin domain-containing protein [Candidatus Heimdallarchaeaceae archaeon]
MSKTLIVFGTRFGATAEVGVKIASILRAEFNLDVNVFDLSTRTIKNLDISEYDNIVIGSGIKMGRWVSATKKFLKHDFEGKKVAVFICSRRGGEPDLYNFAYEHYIQKVLAKFPKLKPIATEVFGGKKPLKNGLFYENRDWNKIDNWARKIGKEFVS